MITTHTAILRKDHNVIDVKYLLVSFLGSVKFVKITGVFTDKIELV